MGTSYKEIIKILPETHCPIMVRLVKEGRTYLEEVCRCDVVVAKKQFHPKICPDDYCPPREHLRKTGEPLIPKYELL